MSFKKVIPALLAGMFLLASCETRNDIIPKSDYLKLPSLSAENFRTVTADSGRTELILSSPLMEQFDNNDTPYTEFRKGLLVEFYDGKPNLQGSVTAKYAHFDKNSQIWELKDSVVVINENNDKLETEQLNWDQGKDLIYTDRFVKITSEDEIIQGFGFQSDSHLHRQEIKKVSAIIYINEEDSL
jgi:LPS export ABC transporter protein LptC